MKQWSDIRMIKISALRVCMDYQRKLDMSWVRHIVNNYDPALVGTLQVSYRDGEYYVFDGQHTKRAIELKFNNPEYPVSCKVYYGLTLEEEAEMFHKFNTSKKRMSTIAIVRAQAAYGDEHILNFIQCSRDSGFTIDPSKSSNSRCNIRAIKRAHECFETLGANSYTLMLKVLKKTWKGAPWSITQNMLSGMEILIRFFGNEFSIAQFARIMSKFTDDDINREAAEYYDLSTAYRYAWAIGSLFNSKGGELELERLNFVNV